MIYLDNAATSWPKPDCVIDAMTAFMKDVGANPGRSGHSLSVEAERIRLDTRELLCELFSAPDPMKVIFTLNVTEAINMILLGYLGPGNRVVTTSMEHNAVLRPLRHLEAKGVEVVLVPCAPDGTLDVGDIEKALDLGAKLVVINHASNVCGTILPVGEIGRMSKERGIPLMVDAAQTAGCIPINIDRDHIDILAFTGHKALLGPTGTGGIVFGKDFDVDVLPPLVFGGTGSRSEEEYQPDFLPDKYESGTANIIGLSGLRESIRWIQERGVDKIRTHEIDITKKLIDGLFYIPKVDVYGTKDACRQTATVSFAINGLENSEVGERLSTDFRIMSRVGLHCAPMAHRTIGTFPKGTVRFGMGPFTTEDEVAEAVLAVSSIARGK